MFERICYWIAWALVAFFVASFFPDNPTWVYVIAAILAFVLSDSVFQMYDMRRAKREFKKKQKAEAKAAEQNNETK